MTGSANEPVLVPIDFSTHSDAALAWAADFAQATGSPLVILHVIHDPAESPGYYLKLLGQSEGAESVSLQPIEDVAEKAVAGSAL